MAEASPIAAAPCSSTTSFQSLRQFVVERQGEPGWTALRAAVHARAGIALPATFATGGWRPTADLVAALNVARDLFGAPDFHERFGAAAAEYELSWVHRVALRFTSPLWLLEHGTAYWQRRHSTGRWEVEGRKGWIRGTLHDFGVVDAGYCDGVRAWILRACLMTGASRTFVVERSCRARGAAACVFEGTW